MREIRYRLRLDDKVVGYEKWYCGERAPDENRPEERYWRANPCWLYSEDGKYWKPTSIFHNHKDQYTGLLDKNGKEIYEGAIVHLEGHKRNHKIIYTFGSFVGKQTKGKFQGYLDGIFFYRTEVIGNIYEEGL